MLLHSIQQQRSENKAPVREAKKIQRNKKLSSADERKKSLEVSFVSARWKLTSHQPQEKREKNQFLSNVLDNASDNFNGTRLLSRAGRANVAT